VSGVSGVEQYQRRCNSGETEVQEEYSPENEEYKQSARPLKQDIQQVIGPKPKLEQPPE